MYYQLPNGKTIWLDVADVLDLSHNDIQDLIAMNVGDIVLNPFKNSVIGRKHHSDEDETESVDEDDEEDLDEDLTYYYKEYYPDEFDESNGDITIGNVEE